MAKAMLIMDMPKNCQECPCSHYEQSKNFWVCHVSSATLKENEFYIEKPKCCPLREVPQKKEDNLSIHLPYSEGYLRGWNDCVDEILGGGE